MTIQIQGFIRERQLRPGVIPVAHSVLWKWVKEGKFPQPIKLSERVTVWRLADVQEWLDSKGLQQKNRS